MGKKPPQIRGLWVDNPQGDGQDLRLDTAAWFAWLEAETTRSFSYALFDRQRGYIVGFMTVRKDGRQRGGFYWSVFWRQGWRLRRMYLGGGERVTAARLERIAQQLLEEAAGQVTNA